MPKAKIELELAPWVLDEKFIEDARREEEERLAKYRAEEVNIMQSECSAETWWHLAETFPIHARCSPLFDLLTLEAPERWAALEARYAWYWTTGMLHQGVSPSIQRQFIAQSLERAMSAPVSRKRYRHPRYKEVVRCLHQWGKGRMSKAKYLQATKDIRPHGTLPSFLNVLKCPWGIPAYNAYTVIAEHISTGEMETDLQLYLADWRNLAQLFRAAYLKAVKRVIASRTGGTP